MKKHLVSPTQIGGEPPTPQECDDEQNLMFVTDDPMFKESRTVQEIISVVTDSYRCYPPPPKDDPLHTHDRDFAKHLRPLGMSVLKLAHVIALVSPEPEKLKGQTAAILQALGYKKKEPYNPQEDATNDMEGTEEALRRLHELKLTLWGLRPFFIQDGPS